MSFFWRRMLIPITGYGDVSSSPVEPPEIPDGAMLFEDGTPMLFEDGEYMLFDN